jgi:phosphotriesterase-related protein
MTTPNAPAAASPAPMIQTVTGPVEPDELGIVLMHEHVITRSPGIAEAFPDTYPRQAVIDQCAAVLARLRADWGVQTLADHTTIELGRDIEILREISVRSGMQIIACTGTWAEPSAYYHHRSPEHSASLFSREIRAGVTDTGIRPGIVKCGIGDEGLTSVTERTIRAAALTHLDTGVPISVHTSSANKNGLVAARILQAEGADPRRVIIGHSGDTEDFGYLHALLDEGVWLGMDRFGIEDRLEDSRRVRVVARLCSEGHTRRLLLSHDASCWSGRLTEQYKASVRPHWNFSRIFQYVLPALQDAGTPPAAIDTMLRVNPRELLAGNGEQ